MWSTPCVHEEAVRRMTNGAGDDQRLQAHLATCAECRNTLEIALAMQALAGSPVPAPAASTPSASYLWWKAELLRRWDAEQRAVEPVEIGERIGVGLSVVGAVLLLLWVWPRMDITLPSLFLMGDAGMTVSWIFAAALVFGVLVLGATAMALLDVGGHDRKG